MRRKNRAATIRDVAKAAGVSVSTVSRVLNAKTDVASETQDRILSIINSLGFTSNLAARSMRSFRRNIIGLIMPDIGYPFAIEVMRGVNRAIAESEFDLLVFTTGDVRKVSSAEHEQKYVSLLNNSITDGVLIVAPVTSSFSTSGIIVSVDPVIKKPGYPSVHATNYKGAMDAMNYLLSLGHERIAYIGGRPELLSSARRYDGYIDSLKKARLAIDETLITMGDFTTDTGAICAKKLFSLKNRPSAIFAGNDQSAIGVYQAAEDLGVRIPEDVSLIGFDNIPESKYLGLTTIDQYICDMGYIATQMLIKLIKNETLHESTYKIQTQLVVRNSCMKIK